MKLSREDFNKRVGENIRFYREGLGLSQDKLAEELDVTQAAVSRYESGKKGTTPYNIVRIAEYLDITPDQLLDYRD